MGDFRPVDDGAPGKRFGKYAKSKGLPFTPNTPNFPALRSGPTAV